MLVWVEQDTGFRSGGSGRVPGVDKLERHICKGNMHLCCHLCRFACKNIDYVPNFGRNNIICDCKRVCESFEVR